MAPFSPPGQCYLWSSPEKYLPSLVWRTCGREEFIACAFLAEFLVQQLLALGGALRDSSSSHLVGLTVRTVSGTSSGGNLQRERCSSSIFHGAVPFPDQAGVKCLSRGAAQAGKYEKWQMCRARRIHFYLLLFQACPNMSLLQGRERADNFPCLENGASRSSN